jgi:tetratricopeptide (TPR) repeat protein
VADTRIDELRRRLERDPGSRLFAQLAEELRKAGDLAEAVRVARAGLAQHPSYPSARLTLGRALLDSGEAGSARVELESALRDAPDNILASRFLAQAQEALGDLGGAAERYRKTLLMAPGDRQVQAALSALEARLAGPPPLPPGATRAPGAGVAAAPAAAAAGRAAAAAPGSGTVRAGAPPLVFAPSPSERATADDAAAAGDELPATLRIRSAQAMTAWTPPPPPPAAAPPAAAAPPPPRAAPVPPGPAEPPRAEAAEATTLPGAGADTLRDGFQSVATPAPPAEPAAPEEPAGSSSPFPSSTLAELYFQQGLVDRAKDVYRQLLEQDPANPKARSRFAELEREAAPGPADERALRRRGLERTIAGLETMLAAVRRR